MYGSNQIAITSKEETQFTEALDQNEISASYDLPIPTRWTMAFINAFTIVSKQNLSWELWLFNSATNLTSDPQTDNLVAIWQFSPTSANNFGSTVTPAAGGGANSLFRYHVAGNMIPYTDQDWSRNVSTGSPKMHMRLVNRSATAKLADVDGYLAITSFVSTGAQSW